LKLQLLTYTFFSKVYCIHIHKTTHGIERNECKDFKTIAEKKSK